MSKNEKAALVGFISDLNQIVDDSPSIRAMLGTTTKKQRQLGVGPITEERIEAARRIIVNIQT